MPVPSKQSLDHDGIKDKKITLWRQQLKTGFSALKADFTQQPNTTRLFKRHSQLIDHLLSDIWQEAHMPNTCCLIAVGGYGRGELYPYSDIDLLILLPDSIHDDAQLNSKIEALIGQLWDIGLNVGHSVRSLAECMLEASKDITVQTNLSESRKISGSSTLYQEFLRQSHNALDWEDFFTKKLKEQDSRHAKFNNTAYNLEPNLKEGPGGLRDLHMIQWLVRCLAMQPYGKNSRANTWTVLKQQNILSPLEARQIRYHERNLQQLRIHLHFLSNRREDRLLFDYQNDLAKTLGYTRSTTKRASEQLMQDYYRSVKFIRLMNEILLKTLRRITTKNPIHITTINAHFESHNGLLEAKSPQLLQQQPSTILEAFLLLQQHPDLTGMGATLLRNLHRVRKIINRDFRQDPQNKARFLEIIKQENGVNHALRAMNRYDILGSYIPAFGKIIGQMQHDLFHVFTVDEHILNVLENLRRFSKPALKHEFPLCSQVFATFDAPYALYLAALFHDIAKGRGGDHSTLGSVDAKNFCRQHSLPKADAELVEWLVESHLVLSSTAQKEDLSDPNVIQKFSHFVQNERKLNALYLLTVADIRGTSPAIWNTWKAKLLENLHTATLKLLQSKTTNQLIDIQQEINARKAQASDKLNLYNLKKSSYASIWKTFGEQYFLRHESDEIAWHSRLLTPHLNTKTPIVRARLSANGDGIQVMIYMQDQMDLFARICHFFDRIAYNILQAKIYTTQHTYALDTFIISEQDNNSVSYNGLLKHIETELTQALTSTAPITASTQGRINRQVKYMPIDTHIKITEALTGSQHLLEIVTNDRPGLLALIARKFLQQNISLHNAKINTLGHRAEDSFLISAQQGNKLTHHQLTQLNHSLHTEL